MKFKNGGLEYCLKREAGERDGGDCGGQLWGLKSGIVPWRCSGAGAGVLA